MHALSRAQQAQLAAEIVNNQPAKDWDSVPELKKFRAPVEMRDGKKRNMTFEQMVDQYLDVKSEIEYRDKELKNLKDAITTGVLVSGEDEVTCSGRPIQKITKQGARKINADKLLGAGVPADTIAKCTDIGDEVTYVQVGRPRKEK